MSERRTVPANRDKQAPTAAEPLSPAQLEAALADARVRRARALARRVVPADPIPSSPWDGVQDLSVPLIDEVHLGAEPYVRPKPKPQPDPQPKPEVIADPVVETARPGASRMTIWLPEHEMAAEDSPDESIALPDNFFAEADAGVEPELTQEERDEELWEELEKADYKDALKKLPVLLPVIARRTWGRRLDGHWRTPEERQHLLQRRAAVVSGAVSFAVVVGIGLWPNGRLPTPQTVLAATATVPAQPVQQEAPLAPDAALTAVDPVIVAESADVLAAAVPHNPTVPVLDDAVGSVSGDATALIVIEDAAADDQIAQAVADAVSQALAEPVDAPLVEAGPVEAEELDPTVGVAVSPRPMPRPGEDQAAVSGPARVVIHAPNTIADTDVSAFAQGVEGAGFRVATTGRPGVTVATNHVRFYHEADRATAERLAGLIGAAPRDFTEYQPAPEAGLVELWLAGESVDLADFRLAESGLFD